MTCLAVERVYMNGMIEIRILYTGMATFAFGSKRHLISRLVDVAVAVNFVLGMTVHTSISGFGKMHIRYRADTDSEIGMTASADMTTDADFEHIHILGEGVTVGQSVTFRMGSYYMTIAACSVTSAAVLIVTVL
jgi:hypothetical protein